MALAAAQVQGDFPRPWFAGKKKAPETSFPGLVLLIKDQR
jgi:hypothetical protein